MPQADFSPFAYGPKANDIDFAPENKINRGSGQAK
jgi:hypothetical protein